MCKKHTLKSKYQLAITEKKVYVGFVFSIIILFNFKIITMATVFSICILLLMVGLGIVNMCMPSTTDRDEKYLQ